MRDQLDPDHWCNGGEYGSSHPDALAMEALDAENKQLRAELERLRDAFTARDTGIQQTLGKALGYPWFKDDQKNFPGSTQEHGVCVGDHVAESLADEAAEMIGRLRAERSWIPVLERVPELGVDVLVLQRSGKYEVAWKDVYDGNWSSYAALGEITHWMPLPEPPEALP